MKISISVKVTVGIFDSFIFFMGWSCAVVSMRFSDSHREKKTILRFSVQYIYISLILSILLKSFRLEQQVFIYLRSKLSIIERIAE